jgi:LPS-assembly protein
MAAESAVLLRADRLSHDQGDDVVRASGNVEMAWAGAHLYAAMASYWREKGLVVAEGGVKLNKNGDTLSGERVEFQLDSQKGTIDKGELFLKQQNIHLGGEKIEKTGEQDYRIKNGTITSCDNPSTGWKFKVEDLKLTLDEFATGRNAVLYLADVPAFWLPYFVFPAKTERQSGFLIPTAGNSSKKGVFLDIPYYFAPSPSMDMTLTADLQSKRGAGLAIEHRYLGENKGQGLSHGYLIYDQEQNKFRGDIEIKQQHNFSTDTYWRADVSYALDRDYFRDYGTMSGEYNRQYLETMVFLSHRKSDLLFTAGADYLNNLDVPNNSTTLQSIPFATANGTGSPLPGTPLYYSFTAAAANFDRDSGWRGQRVILSPQLSLPLMPGRLPAHCRGGTHSDFTARRIQPATAARTSAGSSTWMPCCKAALPGFTRQNFSMRNVSGTPSPLRSATP